MLYFNANGLPGSMCGNGGRCMVAFARFLNLLKTPNAFFLAVDGAHQASINVSNSVSLKMKDVSLSTYNPALIFIDTGSPHHIEFVPDLEGYDVYNIGKSIRNNDRYRKEGTNVNFVQILARNSLRVATYERGVENETLSCGTGVTAAAIAYYKYADIVQKSAQIDIQTKGGKLAVSFNNSDNLCTDIWLSGPTKQVYKGYINLA
jgi:diaminopimelate epimerase